MWRGRLRPLERKAVPVYRDLRRLRSRAGVSSLATGLRPTDLIWCNLFATPVFVHKSRLAISRITF
ncbi:hypothetical protein EMIT0P171_60174 [Pseudomonas sp. IT-P171]